MVEIARGRPCAGVDNKIGMAFFDIRKKNDLKIDRSYKKKMHFEDPLKMDIKQ